MYVLTAIAQYSASCMDSSGNYNIPAGRSPRRELQGPRPAPLRVHKDSHKIKKPPLAPPHQPSQPQAIQHRPPVIIYTVSPKVIHTSPRNFMDLVQRLTGRLQQSSSSSCSSSSSVADHHPSSNPFNIMNNSGAVSPAARYASVEKAAKSPEGNKKQQSGEVGGVEGIEIAHGVEMVMGSFPGILSPGPASLPPISSNFFSPPTDPSPLSSFFHDLSPVLHGSKNYLEGSFMPSPSTFVSPRMASSPTTPSIDLFNNFFDY
ncbi:protein MKS1-like [Juglans microcarpa x Juglans regia]|uniref:protein MKS1-like n=1 Tax=Juglans microcarpa x Juglans regia TaxID=2249226 RepID=UPI001B7E3484|nr:protein MKS1-like [Juglans microcarpa x Juglans regia]